MSMLNLIFVPVLTEMAFKNKGVQPLLNTVVDNLPSFVKVEVIKGINKRTEDDFKRKYSNTKPFSVLAFKVATNPLLGSSPSPVSTPASCTSRAAPVLSVLPLIMSWMARDCS